VEVKEADEGGFDALQDGLVAQGGGDMGFSHAGRSDEDEVDRFLEPVGVEELEDFILRYFGIEGPVKGGQEFLPFDAGHAQEVFDSFEFSFFLFFLEEPEEEGLVGGGEAFQGGEEAEGFPQISQGGHSLSDPSFRSRCRGVSDPGDGRAAAGIRKA